MDFEIERLTDDNIRLIESFSCVESAEELSDYNSKERKRIIKHSREMDDFLRLEAYIDQDNGLNTTHLFIDREKDKLIGFVSLCADSIRLDSSEKEEMGFSYYTVPAVKIARLAVSNEYKHKGFGHIMIDYCVNISFEMLEKVGAAFITLDCYEHRLSYYEGIGFIRNIVQPITLPYDSPISMRLRITDYLTKYMENN